MENTETPSPYGFAEDKPFYRVRYIPKPNVPLIQNDLILDHFHLEEIKKTITETPQSLDWGLSALPQPKCLEHLSSKKYNFMEILQEFSKTNGELSFPRPAFAAFTLTEAPIHWKKKSRSKRQTEDLSSSTSRKRGGSQTLGEEAPPNKRPRI